MRTLFTPANWIAVVVLFAATAAGADLEFAGYIRIAGGTRFVVREATQVSGYTLAAFDERTETLTLTKAGASVRLTLISAAIEPVDPVENWSEETLRQAMEANKKLLVAVTADLNARTRSLENTEGSRNVSAAQPELMKAWMDKLLLRNLLAELVQLQSDLLLYVQMRREEDENAMKTRARVMALTRTMKAHGFN